MSQKTAKTKEGRIVADPESEISIVPTSTANDGGLRFDRRMLLGRGLVAGLLGTLAQSCADANFSSSSARGVRSENSKDPSSRNKNELDEYGNSVEGDVVDTKAANRPGATDGASETLNERSGDDEGGSDGGADAGDGDRDSDGSINEGEDQSCSPHRIDTLDTAKIPQAAGDRVPAVRFYGQDKSAMIALKFPNGAGIKNIIVCKENGRPIAIHAMTGADDGGRRPIILDHLSLHQVDNIKIIIQMDDDKRLFVQLAKSYYRDRGGAVSDLSMGPNSNEQSVAQFVEKYDSFRSDPDVTYPNDYNSQVRNLQTAVSTSSWTRGAGVKGAATDIMGDALDLNGKTIIEHPTFCTYSNGFRTMLRIS